MTASRRRQAANNEDARGMTRETKRTLPGSERATETDVCGCSVSPTTTRTTGVLCLDTRQPKRLWHFPSRPQALASRDIFDHSLRRCSPTHHPGSEPVSARHATPGPDPTDTAPVPRQRLGGCVARRSVIHVICHAQLAACLGARRRTTAALRFPPLCLES